MEKLLQPEETFDDRVYECTLLVTCASRNHQGRRGTTVDIGDNLLPSLTVFGCSLTAVEIETGPLSDVIFPSFLLPSTFPFPWYSVPCTIVLQRPLDLITCPNHRNFLFSQLLLYLRKDRWLLVFFAMWSLHDMCKRRR